MHTRRERNAPDPRDAAVIEHLAGRSEAEGERRRKLQLELLDAIAQISSVARRRIITLHYFQGLSLPEIARKMGRSMNATYKLHFDALAELGKIWGTKGHKDE